MIRKENLPGFTPKFNCNYIDTIARDNDQLDGEYHPFNFGMPSRITLLSEIKKGIKSHQRTGNVIHNIALQLKVAMCKNSANQMLKNIHPQQCRIMIVYDAQPNGLKFVIGDLLDTFSNAATKPTIFYPFIVPFNMLNEDRFTVFLDKQFTMPSIGVILEQEFKINTTDFLTIGTSMENTSRMEKKGNDTRISATSIVNLNQQGDTDGVLIYTGTIQSNPVPFLFPNSTDSVVEERGRWDSTHETFRRTTGTQEGTIQTGGDENTLPGSTNSTTHKDWSFQYLIDLEGLRTVFNQTDDAVTGSLNSGAFYMVTMGNLVNATAPWEGFINARLYYKDAFHNYKKAKKYH